MIGIDTNVLVRYIVEDDAEQAKLATELIEKKCTSQNPAFINLMVLCELTWVLIYSYKCQKEEIKQVLQNLLLTENFHVEYHSIAWQAFYDYENGNYDYSDCLISRLNSEHECEITWTFDKKASKLNSFQLLK